jgi:hypothetical protein
MLQLDGGEGSAYFTGGDTHTIIITCVTVVNLNLVLPSYQVELQGPPSLEFPILQIASAYTLTTPYQSAQTYFGLHLVEIDGGDDLSGFRVYNALDPCAISVHGYYLQGKSGFATVIGD